MDDSVSAWLKYLESLRSGAESTLRVRRAVAVPLSVALLIASILFIYAGGALVLGLIGGGVAVLAIVIVSAYNLKSIVFLYGCDLMVRRILRGELKESAEIDEELEKLTRKVADRSALVEGRRILRGTVEKR